MDCTEFKRWLSSQDLFEMSKVDSARKHTDLCPICRKLYTLDSQIESQIKEELKKTDPPERLFTKINMNVQSTTESEFMRSLWWKKLLPILGVIAILFVYFNPFESKFKSLDEIGTLTVNDHLNESAMTFHADAIKDVSDWFEKRLGFRIEIPDLTDQGLRLAGGGKCHLGKNDVAYLCYDKGEKRVSLFIIESSDVNFHVNEGKIYSLSEKECEVKVWKEENLLYAMVE